MSSVETAATIHDAISALSTVTSFWPSTSQTATKMMIACPNSPISSVPIAPSSTASRTSSGRRMMPQMKTLMATTREFSHPPTSNPGTSHEAISMPIAAPRTAISARPRSPQVSRHQWLVGRSAGVVGLDDAMPGG